MNKRRIIFFAIFGLYHLSFLGFTLYMDAQRENFRFLSNMLRNFSLFKYGAALGLLMLLVDVVWSWLASRTHQKELNALGKEKNELKARVYDMQEQVNDLNTKISEKPSQT